MFLNGVEMEIFTKQISHIGNYKSTEYILLTSKELNRNAFYRITDRRTDGQTILKVCSLLRGIFI